MIRTREIYSTQQEMRTQGSRRALEREREIERERSVVVGAAFVCRGPVASVRRRICRKHHKRVYSRLDTDHKLPPAISCLPDS